MSTLPQDDIIEESRENGEDDDDFQSLIWQEISRNNIVVLEAVIEEIRTEKEEECPGQLFEAANTISETLSGISSLTNHKEDFERLLVGASSLIVVLWQTYNKSNSKFRSLWPPPSLGNFIDELVETVYNIHKLMRRKSKNLANRLLVGCFGIRDLKKFKQYQRRLDSVASGFKSKPNNININEILLEVVNNRAQPRGEDTELSEPEAIEGDSPITKPEAVIQEPIAEGSHPHNAEKPTTSKPTNQKKKSEEVKNKAKDDSEDESSEECSIEDQRAKKKTTSRRLEEEVATQPKPKGAKGTKKVRHPKFDEEALESDEEGKRTRHKELDEEDVEDTSGYSSRRRTNNAAQSKTRKRLSQAYGNEDNDSHVPVDHPAATKGQSKKKRPATTPKQKVTPVHPQYQTSISDFSFNNGSGIMENTNVGNIYNTSISGVGNDHSVNHFH